MWEPYLQLHHGVPMLEDQRVQHWFVSWHCCWVVFPWQWDNHHSPRLWVFSQEGETGMNSGRLDHSTHRLSNPPVNINKNVNKTLSKCKQNDIPAWLSKSVKKINNFPPHRHLMKWILFSFGAKIQTFENELNSYFSAKIQIYCFQFFARKFKLFVKVLFDFWRENSNFWK